MSNTTYRVFVEHLGDVDANTFIADTGDLFWDRSSNILRLGDGTAGGLPLMGGGGNVNAILAGAGIDVQDTGAGLYIISLRPATGNTVGGIIAGNNAIIDANGVLSIDLTTVLNQAKGYTDASVTVLNQQLRANDFITLTAAQAYTDATNTWIQANITGGGGGVSNAQLAQANTWLQANDALTLSVAEAFTNAANAYLSLGIANNASAIQNNVLAIANNASAIQNNAVAIQNNTAAIQNNTLAIQAANTFLQANDALTLSVAEAYTDTANAYLRAIIANTGNVLITSNINSIAVGAAIVVSVDRTNPAYTGGVFNIYQVGGTSASFDGNWTSTSGSSKLAYTDFANNVINTDSVTVRVLLSVGNWDVQANDDITIGSTVITGANLTSLGISGSGGTYVVPSSLISPATEVALISPVSANLTQATVGKIRLSDSSPLVTVQPTLFGISSVSGSFPLSSVPYFSVNQSFNWNVTPIGTVTGGTLSLSGSHTATETSVGAISGNSAVYDSTVGPFTLSATYSGVGQNGSGQTTVNNVPGSVTPATSYIPMFYKITSSNANPNFTTSDTYVTHQYVVGDGANSPSVPSDFLWLAVPGAGANTFFFDSPPFTGISATANTTYSNVDISGQTYQVYGFSQFSSSVFLYTGN